MGKKKRGRRPEPDLPSTRLDPESSLTPKYDGTGIRKFPAADAKQMGFQVKDDFVEEHIE